MPLQVTNVKRKRSNELLCWFEIKQTTLFYFVDTVFIIALFIMHTVTHRRDCKTWPYCESAHVYKESSWRTHKALGSGPLFLWSVLHTDGTTVICNWMYNRFHVYWCLNLLILLVCPANCKNMPAIYICETQHAWLLLQIYIITVWRSFHFGSQSFGFTNTIRNSLFCLIN